VLTAAVKVNGAERSPPPSNQTSTVSPALKPPTSPRRRR
jgi:hypothetical protein